MSERVNVLMDYLDRLTKLNEAGYNCHKEIAECVLRVREGLSIVQKNDNLLVITLEDENSVPKVLYNGEELKTKTRIRLSWDTKTDKQPDELRFDVNYLEFVEGFPVNRGIGLNK